MEVSEFGNLLVNKMTAPDVVFVRHSRLHQQNTNHSTNFRNALFLGTCSHSFKKLLQSRVSVSINSYNVVPLKEALLPLIFSRDRRVKSCEYDKSQELMQ